MSGGTNGRLVILSGPSCVGKSPLAKALARFHPELHRSLRPLVIYNSREARPGEEDGVDYHFRARSEIEVLREKDGFVVMDVRGDLQAVDLHALRESLGDGNVFFEGNPFIGRRLQTDRTLADVNRLSVFMAPFSRGEILFLKEAASSVSLPDLVADVMRRKLLRRTRRQKGELSLKDLENIETRAESAYTELGEAHHFEYVIANHDGEDSENWDAFYHPLGEARAALDAFVALLRCETPPSVENWEAELIP